MEFLLAYHFHHAGKSHDLPTGGDNFHGVYEYLDLYEFNQMRELLTKIADLLK